MIPAMAGDDADRCTATGAILKLDSSDTNVLLEPRVDFCCNGGCAFSSSSNSGVGGAGGNQYLHNHLPRRRCGASRTLDLYTSMMMLV